VVPGGIEAFAFDASFAGILLLEHIESDTVEQGEVLRGVASAFAAEVLAEAYVEHPVQFVFDAPVLADGAVQPRRIGGETGDVVASLPLGFSRRLVVAFRFDAHQTL